MFLRVLQLSSGTLVLSNILKMSVTLTILSSLIGLKSLHLPVFSMTVLSLICRRLILLARVCRNVLWLFLLISALDLIIILLSFYILSAMLII